LAVIRVVVFVAAQVMIEHEWGTSQLLLFLALDDDDDDGCFYYSSIPFRTSLATNVGTQT